eukprot:TRINITY_DN14746_c0_g2_i1.p1 TRINITY_DN14746_c0_g2~~TRINITY_DN14746_c0_g2_i1.p1  ORF type:complete len:3710 (+),score=117.93 TRINITY_DN14746_c0_g2_i1:228-11357(+)
MGGPDCVQLCPGFEYGLVCSRHGSCTPNATCICDQSLETGYWAGSSCEACDPKWSGSLCTIPCPLNPMTKAPCSNLATCTAGKCCSCPVGTCGSACHIQGSVACAQQACAFAYQYGQLCDKQCPGTRNGQACNGHGSCNSGRDGSGICCCEAGFVGPDCSLQCGTCVHGSCDTTSGVCACEHGYAGSSCELSCPRNTLGLICSGSSQGICDEGYLGLGICICLDGYLGSACEQQCPITEAGLCSGHGKCGTQAVCRCFSSPALGYWDGALCDSCLNGWAGTNCSIPCVNGLSSGQTCLCYSGWAGLDCAVECNGGHGRPCSLHGKCFQGNQGNGTCVCSSGFSGADCSKECPGGSSNPCNGHGTCDLITAMCLCANDTKTGFWVGPDCSNCRFPYTTSSCNRVCPSTTSAHCSGHGTCAPDAVCECYATHLQGWWKGAACAECRSGYFGTQCITACPGGACTPCSGHGICDDGSKGTGGCECMHNSSVGYWDGFECNDCQPGYWGTNCTLPCTACNGHGTCDEGIFGTGACLCWESSSFGYWAGTKCDQCLYGWFGPECNISCPGNASNPCNSNGICSWGTTGTGVCTCDQGWVGSGCERRCPVSGPGVCGGHGTCKTDATCTCFSNVTAGFWAGDSCSECTSGWAGPTCQAYCPGGVNCSGHGACDGYTATCACLSGWTGQACQLECTGGERTPCNNHGQCLMDASCTCNRNSEGQWNGSSCSECAYGYSGSNCTKLCPRNNYGSPCSGFPCRDGSCFCGSGYCGTACEITGLQCACDPGYWGPACEYECTGGASLPCSGNGICDSGRMGSGRCSCDSGWAAADCRLRCPTGPGSQGTVCSGLGSCNDTTGLCRCQQGFTGSACDIECPGGWRTPCTFRGQCTPAATCDCQPGFAGSDCSLECPGGPSAPCFFHGTCTHNASCSCFDAPSLGHWTGSACSICAQSWHGSNCTRPCLHGTTVGTDCICSQGWVGVNCASECPGGWQQPCYSHGVCEASATGNATCTCYPGFVSAFCDIECDGGWRNPCNGHGTCLVTGRCLCSQSDETGFWAQPSCDSCISTYFGQSCTLTCPSSVLNAVCSGHGSCDTSTATCTCYKNDTHGHWSGPSCNTCRSGAWGTLCQHLCPGGCNPCGGHGTCDDGQDGSGNCTCAQSSTTGFWQGVACSSCVDSFFGAACNATCPGDEGQPCANHGTCSDGIYGSGRCACTRQVGGENWGGPACTVCAAGFWGVSCNKSCPATPLGICNSAGSCDGGLNGTGECSCNWGYAGPLCSYQCPSSSDKICNGVGSCSSGNRGSGLCICPADNTFGYWTGTSCETCATGYAGELCLLRCPVDAGAICAGHGTCNDGPAGSANCVCYRGFSGIACNLTCPGGTRNPCNGRGDCNAISGKCDCAMNDDQGYWTGATCSSCFDGYSGIECKLLCPHFNGQVCNSHGECRNGLCIICESDWCGSACQTNGTACSGQICPSGFYGPSCSNACPSAGDTVCNGHGSCHSVVENGGACNCDRGYYGQSCQFACPGGAEFPCSNSGECQSDGSCLCSAFSAGPSCALACPGITTSACCGHGTCNNTAHGDASCACSVGWMGVDCCASCPPNPNTPCNGHGNCLQHWGCVCFANPRQGYWNGSACDSCSLGWQGRTCTEPCIHGLAEGQNNTCSCFPSYYGKNCESLCPGTVSYNGSTCNGHGRCSDGTYGSGLCSCETNWYGKNCSVFCTPQQCRAAKGLTAGFFQCNSETGYCECQDTDSGHYTGPNCVDCQTFWYGTHCELPCPCNQHGSCDRVNGQCNCFYSATNGYFAGEYCLDCADGYTGVQCKAENVAVTRSKSFGQGVGAFSTVIMQEPSIGQILVDDVHDLIYVGGRPLVIFNASNLLPIVQQDLGGTITSAWISNKTDTLRFLLWVNPAQCRIVALSRPWLASGQGFTVLQEASFVDSSRRHFESQAATDSKILARILADDSNNLAFFLRWTTGSARLRKIDTANQFQTLQELDLSQHIETVNDFDLDITVHRLVIGGAFQNAPRLLIIGTDSFDLITVSPQIPNCIPEKAGTVPSCVEICSVNAYKGRLWCSVRKAGAVLVAQMDIISQQILSDELIMTTTATNDIYVTSSYLDSGANIGFVAINVGSNPTTLYKFNLTTTITYGSFRGNKVGDSAEIIVAMGAQAETRLLYCLTDLETLHIITVNLYAVHHVYPELADIQGGTPVTITGEGFVPRIDTQCRFDAVHAAAMQSGYTTVVCPAPPLATPRADNGPCTTQAVDISLFGDRFSSNGLPLRRVVSATITEVNPTFGTMAGGTLITVHGYGFLVSPLLRCRFGDSDQMLTAPASYMGPFSVKCVQPPANRPSRIPAFLEVSLDGFVYSSSKVTYDIVGPATGLQVTRASVSAVCTKRTSFAATVRVVDEIGHPRFFAEESGRVITMKVAVADPLKTSNGNTNVTHTGASWARTRSGLASFNVTILSPPTGTLLLSFSNEQQTWTIETHMQVTEGVVAGVAVVEFPITASAMAPNTQPLSAVLRLVDECGNGVSQPSTISSFSSRYEPAPERGSRTEWAAARADGSFVFTALLLIGKYGRKYRIVFTTPEDTSLIAYSPLVAIGSCGIGSYAIWDSETCTPCPTHGYCDGTEKITAQPNYWRWNEMSMVFYECDRKVEPCIGYTPTGSCAPHRWGPLCAVCDPLYVGSSCKPCQSTISARTVFAGACILIIALSWILMLVALQLRALSFNLYPIAMATKLAINYFQLISLLPLFGVEWPDLLNTFFGFFVASNNLVSRDILYCAFTDLMDTFATTFVYFLLPFFALVIAAALPLLVVVCRKVYACTAVAFGAHTYNSAPKKKRSIISVWFSSALVMWYFLYFVVILRCLRMVRCRNFTRENGLSEARLVMDLSISCNDQNYTLHRKVSIAYLLVYGVGFPFLLSTTIILLRRIRGEPTTVQLFQHFLVATRANRWYWESIVLLRKMVICAIAVCVMDNRLQVYLGMWAITFLVALHVLAQPYVNSLHNRVEAFSMGTVALTLNLGLLYEWTNFSEARHWEHWVLTIVIFLISLVTVCGHLLLIIFSVYHQHSKGGKYYAQEEGHFLEDTVEEERVEPGRVLGPRRSIVLPLGSTMDMVQRAAMRFEQKQSHFPEIQIDSELQRTDESNASDSPGGAVAHTAEADVLTISAEGYTPRPVQAEADSNEGKPTGLVFSFPPLELEPIDLDEELASSRALDAFHFGTVEKLQPQPSSVHPHNEVVSPAVLHPDPVISLTTHPVLPLHEIYLEECKRHGVQPNPSVTASFMRSAGEVGPVQWQLGGSVFLGSRGLVPVVDTLRRCPMLTEANLSDLGIGDHGLRDLVAALSGLRHLRFLDLSQNPITPAGLPSLLTLVQLTPCLVEIDLRHTQVTDAIQSAALLEALHSNARRAGLPVVPLLKAETFARPETSSRSGLFHPPLLQRLATPTVPQHPLRQETSLQRVLRRADDSDSDVEEISLPAVQAQADVLVRPPTRTQSRNGRATQAQTGLLPRGSAFPSYEANDTVPTGHPEKSLREIYEMYCRQHGVRVVPSVHLSLSSVPGQFDLTTFQTSQPLFIGSKGVQPLMQTLVLNSDLVTLNLVDVGLGDKGMEYVVDAVLQLPYVQVLDLSDNPLTAASLPHFQLLIEGSTSLSILRLEGTNIPPTDVASIMRDLAERRARPRTRPTSSVFAWSAPGTPSDALRFASKPQESVGGRGDHEDAV